MRKTMITLAGVVVVLAALAGLNMYFGETRLTSARLESVRATEEKIVEAKAEPEEAPPAAPAPAETKPVEAPKSSVTEIPKAEWPETAPEVFRVKFECSNGDIIIECQKEWAPIGVDHFYTLIKSGFYDGARFFRVIPGFMAQFGLPADPALNEKFGASIKDDPVKKSNTPGMVTYAKTGAPNSRSTQLFINTGNNARLDGDGFAPFAQVIEGLDVVRKINAEYRERPNQGMIRMQGNAYLEKQFPNLDFIKRAVLVK